MQYSDTRIQGIFSSENQLYHHSMSSIIAPCAQIPPASLSHYPTSHILRFGPSLPVEQQLDSCSLLLGHAPAPSSLHSSRRTGTQVISEPVQVPTSSAGPSSMFQSIQPPLPPSVYPEPYGSTALYPNPSTRTPLRRGDPELPAVSDGGYASTVCDYPARMDDPYFSRSPETIGETLMLWEAHNSAEVHAGSPPDSGSAYTAPQLTSPANQRAATARRKRTAKYSCNMCGSKLTAKHNLISHMNAHFGIKPFRCQLCKREYTAKSTFRRHLKTVHPDHSV